MKISGNNNINFIWTKLHYIKIVILLTYYCHCCCWKYFYNLLYCISFNPLLHLQFDIRLYLHGCIFHKGAGSKVIFNITFTTSVVINVSFNIHFIIWCNKPIPIQRKDRRLTTRKDSSKLVKLLNILCSTKYKHFWCTIAISSDTTINIL